LAYLLPVLHKVLRQQQQQSSGGSKERGVGAVILVPTRELCTQVHQTIQGLAYYCDEVVSSTVLSVGRGRGERARRELERQEATLRDRPRVVVATPAGLVAHLRSGALPDLEGVETLVIDEADLVLSFGYSNDVAEIVKALPRICQGFLMSATLSPELDSLKKIVLNSPVVLKLEHDDERAGAGLLKQFYLSLPKNDKYLVVYVFLKLGLLRGKGLFFVNSTDAGYRLKLFLEQFHIRSAVLNAELPFRSRMNIIEQYNVGNFDFLIATDASADAGSARKGPSKEGDDEVEGDDGDQNASPTQKKSRKGDSEYGVSRGLDFRNVSFVVNVDFPPNAKSYAHRVGRTARGGAKGVALSLIDARSEVEQDLLLQVQADQPALPLALASTDKLHAAAAPGGGDEAVPHDQPQPIPLDFDLREIEGFRYRVEDVSRAVTRSAIREARASELKAEILNSERLQSRFEENPIDLQLLQHDRVATRPARVREHLKHVPNYLLPRGMSVANLNKKRKRHKKNSTGGARRTDNDPLHAFDGDTNLGTGDEGDGDGVFAEFMEGDDQGERPSKVPKIVAEEKIFTSTKDGTGLSTAGRNAWKEKHRKGKFSGKKRKTDRKHGQPLGI
jgi:ATP-dependent RNA helicase DDX56/DBP9